MAKAKNVEVKNTKPRELIGRVIGLRESTIKIRVERKYPHPKYGKIVKDHKNYLADFRGKDGELTLGDEVRVIECKPISQKKTWKFVEVIKKSEEI